MLCFVVGEGGEGEQNREEGEMAQKSREEGENEMLGVGRYPLERNFSVSDKGWGGEGWDGEFDVYCDSLGSPGTRLGRT